MNTVDKHKEELLRQFNEMENGHKKVAQAMLSVIRYGVEYGLRMRYADLNSELAPLKAYALGLRECLEAALIDPNEPALVASVTLTPIEMSNYTRLDRAKDYLMSTLTAQAFKYDIQPEKLGILMLESYKDPINFGVTFIARIILEMTKAEVKEKCGH